MPSEYKLVLSTSTGGYTNDIQCYQNSSYKAKRGFQDKGEKTKDGAVSQR